MANINETIILTTNGAMADKLAERIGAVTHRVHRVETPEAAVARMDQQVPQALFIDLNENPQAALALTRRMRHSHPAMAVMGIAKEKNADLAIAGLRAGLSDYLVFPNNGDDIVPALRNALNRGAGGGGLAELTAVFSLKGGQGVTSVAVNLADQLQALTGRKVLLLDMNLYRGDAGAYLNQACGYTPFDVIRDRQRMDERLLFSSLVHHKNRFYLLGTPESISDAEQIGDAEAAGLLETLRPYFSYIVVDLPSSFSAVNLAVLEAADRILMVAQQALPEIKSLQSVLEFFRELYPDDSKTHIVVNRHQKGQEISAEDMTDIFDHPVTATLANDYRACSAAVKAGKTLATAAPRSQLCKDFETLAARLSGISPTPSRHSLFQRLAAMVWG